MDKIETKIFAFILMPFDTAFDDIYRLGIKETASQFEIKAERVDEQIFQEGILERIYRQIKAADLVIADMSGQNPNVFYEVGYAHALGKLCVLMTNDAADIPFDLKHHRHIVYGDSISKLKERLGEELAWAKNEITNVQASRVKVVLKNTFGNLEKTKYYAKGMVDIKIDLLNESSMPSADIEAIYFYSGKGWTLIQDGRECPSTDSDIPDFTARHFLTPPLRKLHKNSWAQLKFEANKILAWASDGDVLKDSYRVTGRSVVRLVTSEGNFDYELSLDVTVDEIPF
jgi:nucleoside 2-deoxyribosyltransferase